MRWHRHLITEIPKMVFNVKKKKKQNQRTIAQYNSQENRLDNIKGRNYPGEISTALQALAVLSGCLM